MIAIPQAETLSEYYQSYLKYVQAGDDLLDLMRRQRKETETFLSSIAEDKAAYAYAPGKWQVKEVVGHITDTERILSYRALRFSRNDKTPLPGFDENTFAQAANYSKRSLQNIAAELDAVRAATLALFENFSPEMLDLTGTANNTEVSVRAVVFFIYAHQQHHLKVIRERYLG